MSFLMEPQEVGNTGVIIANAASEDLGNAANLGNTVNKEMPSMPSILEYPLTQFATAITHAQATIYKQRLEMGKALQNSADETELTDLRTAANFGDNQGTLPPPVK